MERLGQVVVGAQVEPLHLVLDGVLGREDDDVPPYLLPCHLAEQGEPTPSGEHDVQQNAVILIDKNLHIGCGIVWRLFHHIPLFPQEVGNNLAQVCVIFYDKYLHSKKQYQLCETIHCGSKVRISERKNKSIWFFPSESP